MVATSLRFFCLVLANFVLAAGVLWALDPTSPHLGCIGNPVACKTWDESNPLIPGYCCMQIDDLQTVGCSGTEFVACTPDPKAHCGRLAEILTVPACSFELTNMGCGG